MGQDAATHADNAPSFLDTPGGGRLGYHRSAARAGVDLPGVVFLTGFRSDMTGGKAVRLEEKCREAGQAFLRFDYGGHGVSSGAFEDGTIGQWTKEAILAIDRLTDGPQILVGSSMGGWIMLLAALEFGRRAQAKRIAGLCGIAAAADFTEDLMWARFPESVRSLLREEGRYSEPSTYSDEPVVVTRTLIEEARRHLLLRNRIRLTCPVRLLQGMRDPDVPWETALRIADALDSEDVDLILIKTGDHRLSTPADLARLVDTVAALSAYIAEAA